MRSYLKRSAAAPSSWSVPALCAAYQWPTGMPGTGVIALIELGGNWAWADVAAYFTSIGQLTPSITDVIVDRDPDAPGGDADGEVALDIQVAGASFYCAAGRPAEIRVYWTTDIAKGVAAAMADGCDVCSISWGADEAEWGVAAAQAMDAAAAVATSAGMVVLAAAGDNDSSDGGAGAANVDVPAACPHVLACGGTRKTVFAETVWNNDPGQSNGSGTGGGYSTFFSPPAWQGGLAGASGRMVPDFAAVADPETGYQIIVAGQPQVVGGTSAVAPLYAGLLAAAGRKLGLLAPTLWAAPSAFADITSGDNGQYHAAVGPDPCTGLGAPIGRLLVSAVTGVMVGA
jgi:kumamolisin